MYADPWTEATDTIEAVLSRLLSTRRLGSCDLWDAVEQLTGQLLVLAEQTASVGWPPRIDRVPRQRADRDVGRLLSSASADAPTQPQVETARENGRIERTDGRLRVPLGEEWPVAANWYVVLPWAADRLRGLAEDCRRLTSRVETVTTGFVVGSFEDVVTMCEDLARLVEWLPAVRLWRDPPEGLAETDFREIESFLRRAITASVNGETER